jgi:hypothetical protein
MTLYEFKQLDELEQWQIVWDTEPIAFRDDEPFHYDLYQVDAFYVEVRYTKFDDENETQILRTGLRSFVSTGEPLEPYLAHIKVDI